MSFKIKTREFGAYDEPHLVEATLTENPEVIERSQNLIEASLGEVDQNLAILVNCLYEGRDQIEAEDRTRLVTYESFDEIVEVLDNIDFDISSYGKKPDLNLIYHELRRVVFVNFLDNPPLINCVINGVEDNFLPQDIVIAYIANEIINFQRLYACEI